MIWSLLVAHVAAVVAIIMIGDRLGRAVFAIAAAVAGAAACWSLTVVGSGSVETASFDWVTGLDLGFAFRVDALSALLGLVVSGIGGLVFTYAAGYFSAGTAGVGRFAATLLAFSTAMLGLVWSDSVWTLFVFWELTSITSFLLVGHKHADAATRIAARRALLITASGGLVLLAGFVVLADASSVVTARLRDLEVTSGTGAVVAGVLVLLAAATKSAQVPFHVWLPGAMAAPTPVSAYLHSATMVKAGLIVVAFLGPALGETGAWTPLGITLGLVSMMWGAVGALRQVDGKAILAWGTVSQLGLMFALFSIGSGKATLAALSILVAHAVFKAALFMVVGEIDIRTGTRDVRELSGLWRTMPIAFVVALVSGLSMAGVPPFLGFPAKEAALEAALGLDGAERVVLLVGVVGGSVLTVAYTVRFLHATFATVPGRAATEASARRPAITAVTSLLGLGSVVGFVALGVVSDVVVDAAVLLDPTSAKYTLIRWPGLKTAFVISLAIIAVGGAVGAALVRRTAGIPAPVGARAVDGAVDGVLALARRIAAQVQHGSLPVYMVTAVIVAVSAATPFVTELDLGVLEAWDHPLQAVVGALVVGGAFALTLITGRLAAALALGAVGFGVAGLFVIEGAPDLALTQLLVETVVVVAFVVGLGRLGRTFPYFGALWRWVRVAASVAIGVAVALGLAAGASRPTGSPPVDDLTREAVETGGGNNVVNVILTDIRALDTLGEVIVLVAVAVGVIALARAGRAAPVDADSDERVPEQSGVVS